MKKTIIAAMLSAMALTAMAEDFATVTYNPSIKDQSTKNIIGDSVGLILGTTAFKFVTVDGKLEAARGRNTGTVVDAAQVRGTFTLPVTKDIDVFARGGLGRSWTAGNDYSFYTYAGGVNIEMNSVYNVFASVERSQSFKAGNPHFTKYEGGLGYNINKTNNVAVSLQRSLGDVNTSGVQLGYTHKF